MALPIIQQIIADLVTTIEGVTTGNGYEISVDSVYRPATIGDFDRTPAGNYVVQLLQDDPLPNPDNGFSGNPPRVAWDQPIQLDLIYRPSDDDTDPMQQVLDVFEAEIIKAVMADPQRNDLAIDTNLSPSVWWTDKEDGTAGKSLVVTIEYRHQENDPTAQ